jgi:hypothetical protein
MESDVLYEGLREVPREQNYLWDVAEEVYGWYATDLAQNTANIANQIMYTQFHRPFPEDHPGVFVSPYRGVNRNNATSFEYGSQTVAVPLPAVQDEGFIAMRIPRPDDSGGSLREVSFGSLAEGDDFFHNGERYIVSEEPGKAVSTIYGREIALGANTLVKQGYLASFEPQSDVVSNVVGLAQRPSWEGSRIGDVASIGELGEVVDTGIVFPRGEGKVAYDPSKSVTKATWTSWEDPEMAMESVLISLGPDHQLLNFHKQPQSAPHIRNVNLRWIRDYYRLTGTNFSGWTLPEQSIVGLVEIPHVTDVDWTEKLVPIRVVDDNDTDRDWNPDFMDRFARTASRIMVERELYPYAPRQWWESTWLGAFKRPTSFGGDVIWHEGDIDKKGGMQWLHRFSAIDDSDGSTPEYLAKNAFYYYRYDTQRWYFTKSDLYPMHYDMTTNQWAYWWEKGARFAYPDEWAPPPPEMP